MKKVKRPVIKEVSKRINTKDNSFIICEISLDDKANQEYFDSLAYEEYLKDLESNGGGFFDEQ